MQLVSDSFDRAVAKVRSLGICVCENRGKKQWYIALGDKFCRYMYYMKLTSIFFCTAQKRAPTKALII